MTIGALSLPTRWQEGWRVAARAAARPGSRPDRARPRLPRGGHLGRLHLVRKHRLQPLLLYHSDRRLSAWDRRHNLAGVPIEPLPWVAFLTLPLGFAWLVAERLGIMEGRQLIAMTLVEVLFLAVLGWRMFRALAAPLLYLYFLVPFGAFITPQLQDFTTGFIYTGLGVLQIPYAGDGYMIQIPEGRFYVAEACAGLRFLIASIAFGTLYACLIYRSFTRRAAVHAGVDHHPDHRQRPARTWHRGARPSARQCAGGGHRPHPLWLAVLLDRHSPVDHGRPAVPRGPAAVRRGRAGRHAAITCAAPAAPCRRTRRLAGDGRPGRIAPGSIVSADVPITLPAPNFAAVPGCWPASTVPVTTAPGVAVQNFNCLPGA